MQLEKSVRCIGRVYEVQSRLSIRKPEDSLPCNLCGHHLYLASIDINDVNLRGGTRSKGVAYREWVLISFATVLFNLSSTFHQGNKAT